jgi:uncharacterized protein YkwD
LTGFCALALSGCVGIVGVLDDGGGGGSDAAADVPTIMLMDGGDDGSMPDGGGGDTGTPPDGSPTDTGGGGCPAGQSSCGGTCIDTSSDPSNCGMCGRICSMGATCSGGSCMGGTGCAPAPGGSSAGAQAAFEAVNDARVAMGVPCMEMIPEINTAAQNHCDYYAMGGSSCQAGHQEIMGCPGFTGVNFWERMAAAGYTGSAASEDMAFSNNGASAVRQWIDSVWHRTPVLSPWIRHCGYGGAPGCDTMDFGRGPSTPSSVTAVWPYANQTGVPTSFDGRFEGPMPPAPPTGWPSGYPITIYVQGSLTTHTLTVDGESTPIDHVWITPSDSPLLSTEYVMYANGPLSGGTTYRVHVSGSVDLEWTFTTR